jgi:signal transduction histidine kinase/CheY-like chemotaxis protein
MSIIRKILIAIVLTAVIPALATFYVFKNPSVFVFSTRNLVIFISIFIGLLGMAVFSNLIYTMAKLCNSLKIIAKGDINHRFEIRTSNDTEDLVVSINQVSQKLRESADELEKRAILLERFNLELKKISKLKSAFPDIVHDLRSPLINIDKISSLLLEKNLGTISPDDKNFLKSINNNAKRLSRLVNNLLDISKMEAGQLSLKFEPLSVKDIVDEAVNSVDTWRQSKNLSLEIKISENLPQVYADRDRIIQILVNLLSNAIRFTSPKGKILVEVKNFSSNTDIELLRDYEVFIEFAVEDNGIGIPELNKNAIFERYKTASEVSFNALPSTGLGLPIAKQIVEMHGGKIWVKSRTNKGSRFTFIIPQFQKTKSKEIKLQDKEQVRKILILEDEDSVRELLDQQLRKRGYFVTVARDGLEGLEKAIEDYYGLVITDVRLPNVDGLNCIKILKRVSPELAFIVITGFPIEEKMEELLKRDAYPCIKKPFDLEDFLKTVENAFLVSPRLNN